MPLLICSLVATFFGVVLTGPAGVEWIAKRRATRLALEGHPRARVTYLPSACCRPKGETDSIMFADGGVVHWPVVSPTERAFLVLVTFTGPWGLQTSRLDVQKRMFIDAVPQHLDSKEMAVLIVSRMRELKR